MHITSNGLNDFLKSKIGHPYHSDVSFYCVEYILYHIWFKKLLHLYIMDADSSKCNDDLYYVFT